MTRKNIFEILKSKYEIPIEMSKISMLFYDIKIVARNPLNFNVNEYSIEQLFEIFCFTNWKQRGSYLSCDEMKKALDFPKGIVTKEQDIIKILEYYINILVMLNSKLNLTQNINFGCPATYKLLNDNIEILLEHLNYEKIIFNEEEKVILVPKNPAATAVAEVTENKDISFAILKYNHASLRGNLPEKKRLLVSIANEYEALLDNPVTGFAPFFDKTNGLLNSLNLRHNNKKGKHKNALAADILNEELEKWYDELYQLLLFCVLIKDNVKRKNEIDELLKKLKKK